MKKTLTSTQRSALDRETELKKLALDQRARELHLRRERLDRIAFSLQCEEMDIETQQGDLI